MKICIIAFARTRSSMLLETISLFYNIPILGQEINELAFKGPLIPSSYKSIILNDSLVKDGVLRLHPLHFHPERILQYSEEERTAEFDLFNFKQYDQVYVVYREPVSDLIASFLVAEKLATFTYQHNIKPFKNIEPIEITPESYKHIKGHIHSENFVRKLKEYFTINNIKYKDLFYDDIPKFCKKNYPGGKTFHLETNYNYKKIIKNYDEILPLYNYYKDLI
jgi:hypothetical protein